MLNQRPLRLATAAAHKHAVIPLGEIEVDALERTDSPSHGNGHIRLDGTSETRGLKLPSHDYQRLRGSGLLSCLKRMSPLCCASLEELRCRQPSFDAAMSGIESPTETSSSNRK